MVVLMPALAEEPMGTYVVYAGHRIPILISSDGDPLTEVGGYVLIAPISDADCPKEPRLYRMLQGLELAPENQQIRGMDGSTWSFHAKFCQRSIKAFRQKRY